MSVGATVAVVVLLRKKIVSAGGLITSAPKILLGLFLSSALGLGLLNPDHAASLPEPVFSQDLIGYTYYEQPSEEFSLGGVNLFRRSLENFTLGFGALELSYSHSTFTGGHQPGNIPGDFTGIGYPGRGNFYVNKFKFFLGPTVQFPVVETALPFGEGEVLQAFILGGKFYRLQLQTTSVEPDYRWSRWYSLPKHGRFLIKHGPAFGLPLYGTLTFHDTASGAVYTLAFDNETRRYWPESAALPGGYGVTFHYTNTDNPYDEIPRRLTSVRLHRTGWSDALESLTVSSEYSHVISAYVINSVVSNKDPARNAHFFTQTVVEPPYSFHLLGSVEVGGSGTQGSGFLRYYLSYTDVDHPYGGYTKIPTQINAQSPNGKQLLKFRLGTITTANGVRTAYDGVWAGPDVVDGEAVRPLAFEYSQGNDVTVRYPANPGNPVTFTLHSTRGLPVKKKFLACPYPAEELIFIPEGEPNAGAIQQEIIRHRCDKVQTKNYIYDPVNFRLSAIQVVADGQTRTTSFTQESVSLPNGGIASQVSSVVDPLNAQTTYGRDSNGRLEYVSKESGLLTSTYDYEYWDAEETQIKKISVTHPNGRQDATVFDSKGQLDQIINSAGTPEQVTTYLSYLNEFGWVMPRLHKVYDGKGNISQFFYNSGADPRLKKIITSAFDGSEVRTTEIIDYHAGFPEAPLTVKKEITDDAGNTQTLTVAHEYLSEAPLLTSIRSGATVLQKVEYEPQTLRPTKVCGFSLDGTDQNCSVYTFKDLSAGYQYGLPELLAVVGGAASNGRDVYFNYNSYAEPIGITQSDGYQTITDSVEYDGFGAVKKLIRNPNQGGLRFEREFLYDAAGRLAADLSKVGNTLIGAVGMTYESGFTSRIASKHDSISGTTVSFEYNDTAKRVTRERLVSPNGTVIGERSVNSADYDLYDRPTVVTHIVDGRGRFTDYFSYNKFGERESYADARGNLTTYEYDSFGRVKSWNDGVRQGVIARNVDAAGNILVTETSINLTSDPSLNFPTTRELRVDKFGRSVEAFNQESGVRVSFDYDNKGRLASKTTNFENGIGTESQILEYVRDDLGRVTELKRNGLSLWKAVYSGFGLIREYRDSRNLSPTTYEYDLLSRPLRTIYPDGTQSVVNNITYLPEGSAGPFVAVNSTTSAGDNIIEKYNALHQPIERVISNGTQGTKTENFSYAGDRLSSKTSSYGTTVTQISYGYANDLYGRVTSETTSVAAPDVDFSFTVGRAYDEQGFIIAHEYPDDLAIVEYLRDNRGRIYDIKLDDLTIYQYTYDGPFLTRTFNGEWHPWSDGLIRTFDYDSGDGIAALSRVEDKYHRFKHCGVPGFPCDTVISDVNYSYDDMFRLEARSDSGLRQISEEFVHDDQHMLDSYQFSSPVLGPETFTRQYSANLDGILDGIQHNTVDSMFRLPGAFSYNLRNQPLSGGGRAYSWSFDGLTGVTDQSLSASFLQDPLGRYVWLSKEDLSGTASESSTFVRDRGMVLAVTKTESDGELP